MVFLLCGNGFTALLVMKKTLATSQVMMITRTLIIDKIFEMLAGPLETGSTPDSESTFDVLCYLRRGGHKVRRSRETPDASDSEAVTSQYAQDASRTLTTASSGAYKSTPVPEVRILCQDACPISSRKQ